jgi:hypothetical protein
MWTRFWDMNSGGGKKEKYAIIYIEAPETEACIIFFNRFGHNPLRVTCTCCGADYAVEENSSLYQLTGYHRQCDYVNGEYVERKSSKKYSGEFVPLEDYKKNPECLFIYENEILDSERKGTLPEQDDIWRDE